MERMMCSREPPWLLGLLLIGRANFVARIICSRRPLSQRPIYSSVLPIVSGVEPRGYALAVSKKKTPLSNALSIMAREVGSSHWFPKVIVPRQISETFKPVRPKRLIFIAFSSSLLLIVYLMSVWQVPCSLTTGSSLEEKSSMSAKAEKNGLCLVVI